MSWVYAAMLGYDMDWFRPVWEALDPSSTVVRQIARRPALELRPGKRLCMPGERMKHRRYVCGDWMVEAERYRIVTIEPKSIGNPHVYGVGTIPSWMGRIEVLEPLPEIPAHEIEQIASRLSNWEHIAATHAEIEQHKRVRRRRLAIGRQE